MFSALISLAVVLSLPEVALDDLATYNKDDREHIKYLICDEEELQAVSFTLNSLSNKKKIVIPSFVNKGKTLIRFDIRHYGLKNKAYEEIGNDPYTKGDKDLKTMSGTKNPIIRADYFVIKAWTAPTYYKLLDVSTLSEFREKYGYSDSISSQAAVVVNGNIARTTRYMKRSPTLHGSIWEARESATINYITELLSDDYDSIQVIASNPNGLISYFAGDSKGKSLNELNPDVAMDYTRAFEPDLVVRVARNCASCHTSGVIPFDDGVRRLLKKTSIKILEGEKAKKIVSLFGKELPIARDKEIYENAVFKTTELTSVKLHARFIGVWQKYYEPLDLKQVAKELGVEIGEFKKSCEQSDNPFLLSLLLYDKISRANLELVLQGK